jgi:hypothetical protein
VDLYLSHRLYWYQIPVLITRELESDAPPSQRVTRFRPEFFNFLVACINVWLMTTKRLRSRRRRHFEMKTRQD